MDNIKKIVLRLPKPLWEKLKQQAEKESRSLNSQIVHLLQKSIDGK